MCSSHVCRVIKYIFTMTFDYTAAKMTLDIIVPYATVAFVITLVALLTLPLVMWRLERLWYFIVLLRIHLSNLVCN